MAYELPISSLVTAASSTEQAQGAITGMAQLIVGFWPYILIVIVVAIGSVIIGASMDAMGGGAGHDDDDD
jgi:ABC-type microcin C transport system permease subunit YejE